MIYLNNAATSFPKPACVTNAFLNAVRNPPASQFRSFGFETESVELQCKKNLGLLLGIEAYQRIFLTSGATDALNQVIHGICSQAKHIVTTDTEHNSVLRPLYNLNAARDCVIQRVQCDNTGNIPLSFFQSAINDNTDAIIVNHCSNVTGAVQDLKEIGLLAHKHHALFIVDASQSAGCIPIPADQWGIDILVFTGHKSLLGVQGTGGFYVHPNLDLEPFKYGGTGRDSQIIHYEGEEREYEVGTQNLPGIASLNAGITYLLALTQNTVTIKEHALMTFLYEKLAACPRIQLYGDAMRNPGPVLSFNILGLLPADVAYILLSGYDIHVRTGLHCAPLIHEHLHTSANGTVRISISPLTEQSDIITFTDVINDICKNLERKCIYEHN